MAKKSNVGDDRLGQVFSVLSDGEEPRNPPPEKAAGNPWKVATFLLLIAVIALPMASSIRESGRQREREGRVDEAREAVVTAREYLDGGRVGPAILSLGKVNALLADIPESDRMAGEITAEYWSQVSGRERAEQDLTHHRRVAAVRKKAVDLLLAGDTDGAAKVLSREAGADPAARDLLTLTRRLVRWLLAEKSEGDARGVSLQGLSLDWPLPALVTAAKNESARARTRRRVAMNLHGLRAAVARRDLPAARKEADAILLDSGLEGLDMALSDLSLLARLERAHRLQGAGDLRAAAAAFEALRGDGVTEATAPAAELSEKLRREWLGTALGSLLDEAKRTGAHLDAAVLEGYLAAVEGRDRPDIIRSAGYRKWLAWRASSLLSDGEVHAALAVAREAEALGSSAAKGFVQKLEGRLAEQAAAEALARARMAAEFGAYGYARAVLEAAGVDTPPELAKELAEIERKESIVIAYCLLAGGDGESAAIMLEKMGPGDDPDLREALGRAYLLRGEIEKGLQLFPEKPLARMMALVRAAVALPATDRAGFAALVARAIEVAGPRADLQAALAVALDEMGQKEEAAVVWHAVRDAALTRAPLVEPKDSIREEVKPDLPDEKPIEKPEEGK